MNTNVLDPLSQLHIELNSWRSRHSVEEGYFDVDSHVQAEDDDDAIQINWITESDKQQAINDNLFFDISYPVGDTPRSATLRGRDLQLLFIMINAATGLEVNVAKPIMRKLTTIEDFRGYLSIKMNAVDDTWEAYGIPSSGPSFQMTSNALDTLLDDVKEKIADLRSSARKPN